LRRYAIDFDKTEAIVQSDLAVMEGDANKILPNFGVGIYYNTELFYVGWSVPHVLSGNISLYDVLQSSAEIAVEESHHYIMAGLKIGLNENVKLKPAMMVKKVKDAPIDMDIHGSLVFNDQLGIGATYRMGGIRNSAGESVDLIAYMHLKNGMRLGVAYDYTLSEVRRYNSGSFEIMLEQCLKGKNDKLTNPRFFF
jgi:type IX secretion system PorP/SprF family membrane protein